MSDLESAWARLRRRRERPVHAVAAMLLPYGAEGEIDWEAFERHLDRTHAAGLDVAVNMDTGFGDLLSQAERELVLDRTRARLGPGVAFYAGAFASDDGDPVASHRAAVQAIAKRDAIPVIVQHPAMHGLSPADKAGWYANVLVGVELALAFELGPVFAPHGEIWDDETFARIVDIPQLVGAKHSSLDRGLELKRLADRDAKRPDFRIYTGNDLAIDMVVFGSDYLLGLATFAPEGFAARDRALMESDVGFLGLNDALQHLGNVGFRAPVPAYKHSAALYLHITGALDTACIHPQAPRRPASDRIALLDCALRLGAVTDREAAFHERVAPYL
jgi:4-hydroxy-tetrahydrodipicolinate synthase